MRTILPVEDEPELARVVARELACAGYRVEPAREALTIAAP
jgi:DNA-binding response OmpR family regulator